MKTYGIVFGTGDSRPYTGLSPTFILFFNATTGATLAPPGITETLAGSGMYSFFYGPTFSIFFQVDGGAILNDSIRYVKGVLDPIQAVDEKVGTIDDSFGTTSADPTTLLGYAKRNLEFDEGNAVFDKTTGTWDIYSRGSSTLLREKILTNTTTEATKD